MGYGVEGNNRSLRESVLETGLCESEKRAESYNKGKVDRELSVGDLVLCRRPGLASKLADSWEGPYTVIEKFNKVNYKSGRGRWK